MASTISPSKSPNRMPQTKYPKKSPARFQSPRKTPDTKSPTRFTLGRQSSLAPLDRSPDDVARCVVGMEEMEAGFNLMFAAHEGDLDGVREALDSGVEITFKDIDERSALHIASSGGRTEVVKFLLGRGAVVDPKDRWGSTPLADAIYYKHQDVIELLEKYGAKHPAAPMHVELEREVPVYDIPPDELDFTNTFHITKGTFSAATWRGIQVAAKTLPDHVILDEEKTKAFRDELALLQQLRHPNVVQFLGAVTQSSPMTIITEYLPKGDLRAFLDKKGALRPSVAVKYALDIARGLNYLHQLTPAAIVHCDLEPSNILRDDSGHLKVADFGLSKLQTVAMSLKGDSSMAFKEFAWRYMAPEVFRSEEYDTKVDVFSFALILQEMIEGTPPFPSMLERDVPKAYCAGGRPPFSALEKNYPYGLQLLIEQCWNDKPYKRPAFSDIIKSLEDIDNKLEKRRRFKLHFAFCNCFWKVQSKQEKDVMSPSSHATVSIIR